ncbi:LysE family translocator [Flavobacterium sp. ASW18X]|uniref:LysE family translocator n=1 Tax=Flavobacterium sp. ASW18X TaxID=2572595 RepID=UPI0010AEB64A|nr:LysE family translocator [Flavobacterium sp. ASW18X]TKD61345.1 LysE family translocator [Flavobacterium sp. ASW18X]
MSYEILLAFCIATATLAIAPGPDNIFVLVQSMVYGRTQGLAVVVGLMMGCLIHTSLLAFGVSSLIKSNETIYWSIKVFGAIYLLYLAFKVFKSKAVLDLKANPEAQKSNMQLFKKGFWMNVLNPKVTIFFLAFFPGFLFSEELSYIWQFYILGFIFIGVSFTIFGAIAVLAGSISDKLKRWRLAPHFFKWLQIVVFLGLAVFLLLSGK